MAIVCDFRECQKVLEINERRSLIVNINKYVVCERCEQGFLEHLQMYLFEPTRVVAEPTPAIHVLAPRDVQAAQVYGGSTQSWRDEGSSSPNLTANLMFSNAFHTNMMIMSRRG